MLCDVYISVYIFCMRSAMSQINEYDEWMNEFIYDDDDTRLALAEHNWRAGDWIWIHKIRLWPEWLGCQSTRHSPKSYDELTGASNAVLSLLWRVNRMLLSAHSYMLPPFQKVNVVATCCDFFAFWKLRPRSWGTNALLAVRLWCLLVRSWPPLCDESTVCRVDRVTSWPCDSTSVHDVMYDGAEKKFPSSLRALNICIVLSALRSPQI